MKLIYQYGMLILSLVIWAFFVHWYLPLFILLAELICFINHSIWNKRKNRIIIVLFIVLSVLVFFFLKKSRIYGISLPIGYSVFVFSAISILVDARKSNKNFHRIDIYNYLFLFPKAFAGPIDRASTIISQIHSPIFSYSRIYIAGKIILFAGFCKYVIADNFYNVNCDTELGFNAFLSIVLYAIAFYFDFYSYSLFAVGIGKLLGIELSMNFISPYNSTSFKDFWSKWNITLSSWLKDYIYIPLGGNRLNSKKTIANIYIVFLISAIWHDCTLPFLLWGISHASLTILEKFLHLNSFPGYKYFVFISICFLWQFFRIEELDDLTNIFNHLISGCHISFELLFMTIIALTIMIIVDKESFKHLIFKKEDNKIYVYKEVSVLIVMLSSILLLPHNLNLNFFYLRF